MLPSLTRRLCARAFSFTSLACLLTLHFTPDALPAPKKTESKTAGTAAAATAVPDEVDKVAQVQVKSALKVLQEGRPGVVYVIVRNTSTVPVKLLDVTVTPDTADPGTPAESGGGFISTKITGLERGKEIAPQQAQRLRVDVEAAGQIREGAHLLLVEVMVQWEKDKKPLTGSVQASHEFNVEVFAAAGVLSLLGVSSILFLPGFLFVTIFVVLERWGKNFVTLQGEAGNPAGSRIAQLDLKSPEFWVFALTASLLAAFAYPWLSQWWFGEKRDYLKGYGVRDVVLLWFGSMVAAMLIWVALMVVRVSVVRYVRRCRTRMADYEAGLALAPEDKPADLLHKLAKQWEWRSLSLPARLRFVAVRWQEGKTPPSPVPGKGKKTFPANYPRHVEVKEEGADESYFLLERPAAGAKQVLLVPPIFYRYVDLVDDKTKKGEQDKLREELDAALKRDDGQPGWDAGLIAGLFERGVRDGLLEVKWDRSQSSEEKSPRFVLPRQYAPRPAGTVLFFKRGKTS